MRSFVGQLLRIRLVLTGAVILLSLAAVGSLQQIQTPRSCAPTNTLSPLEQMPPMSQTPAALSFSHLHLYVDRLEDLSIYKDLEQQLNDFSSQVDPRATLEEKQAVWKRMTTASQKEPYVPQNRDVVKQLLASFGFRVTGASYPSEQEVTTTNTRSLLVTSRDPCGVQIVVTAAAPAVQASSAVNEVLHFDASKVNEFFQSHEGFQGIAALAFCVQDLERIKANYERLHPALVANYQSYDGNVQVFEVYAYYKHHATKERQADKGTILRFIQDPNEKNTCHLPGLAPVEATFEDNSAAAYCDHWVSNVFSRTEFLDTLEDTLGFTPKVDFNAGVVAAGEAQIESTVTGNTSVLSTSDKDVALRDQSQVYLPINNALSSVGHVYGFLQELGQGVQHVASRVENLVDFVQRGNDYRRITGEGFTFLRIPRSYYGVLTADMLTGGIKGDTSDCVTDQCANELVQGLTLRGTLTKEGALDLELSREDLDIIVEEMLSGHSLEEYRERREGVLKVMMLSRYKNLYALLRENVSEATYLGIVRNQILVDIQGDDLLYQIFTSNILQRNAGEEAPFFEYIQRVCSECLDEEGCPQKIRPGCGGFGIRNFLTLFLSIEVSKAMQEVTDALLVGDEARLSYAQAMVDCFTEQLNEANPILTEISDAMTLEGQLREKLAQAAATNGADDVDLCQRKMADAAERKLKGNQALMDCSMRYNDRMKSLRETREKQAGTEVDKV
jgi:4-hydroxyphenylpyruvate dioxygenase-like putative hemolysin